MRHQIPELRKWIRESEYKSWNIGGTVKLGLYFIVSGERDGVKHCFIPSPAFNTPLQNPSTAPYITSLSPSSRSDNFQSRNSGSILNGNGRLHRLGSSNTFRLCGLDEEVPNSHDLGLLHRCADNDGNHRLDSGNGHPPPPARRLLLIPKLW
ncbi:hypothetical protein Syun_013005 [Stephania yunnanensis]|uniref:Uncharacterized protein n=1 Tax=Stephania yunnanensis TaxID=152371 RepID=A0AAP0PJF9_9MAGN